MGMMLKEAIISGDVNQLKKLVLTVEDLDERDKDGRTPLLHAAIDNRIDLVEILLASGADINVRDSIGYTPLHYAAQNYYIELAKLLISNNSQVDAKDIHGNTPLFKAVFNSKGRGEAVRLLIENGADKNLANNHGISPFQLAQNIANYNVVQFLE